MMQWDQCVTRPSDNDTVYWWIVPQHSLYLASGWAGCETAIRTALIYYCIHSGLYTRTVHSVQQCWSTRYVATLVWPRTRGLHKLSPHNRKVKHEGGRIQMVSTTYSVSHLGFTPPSWTLKRFTRFLVRAGFLCNYFVAGEDDKVIFSIPINILMMFSQRLKLAN